MKLSFVIDLNEADVLIFAHLSHGGDDDVGCVDGGRDGCDEDVGDDSGGDGDGDGDGVVAVVGDGGSGKQVG